MFVNPDNTTNRPDGTYGNVINQIQKDGVCPFCPEQLSIYHKNPILITGTNWLVTDNMYPYKGTKHHVLFIHKKHIASITELTTEAWNEFHTLLKQILKERDIKGGAFFCRFGDTNYTGASVTHLHAHLVSADIDAPNREPVLARLG